MRTTSNRRFALVLVLAAFGSCTTEGPMGTAEPGGDRADAPACPESPPFCAPSRGGWVDYCSGELLCAASCEPVDFALCTDGPSGRGFYAPAGQQGCDDAALVRAYVACQEPVEAPEPPPVPSCPEHPPFCSGTRAAWVDYCSGEVICYQADCEVLSFAECAEGVDGPGFYAPDGQQGCPGPSRLVRTAASCD